MKRPKVLIGRAESIALPAFDIAELPARIDTGAKTSSIWASEIREKDGVLSYVLFDQSSAHYTGELHSTVVFEKTMILSSIGEAQERYKIRLLIKLKGKKIRARFTLADRSKQVYPVLVGRNVLRGKFIVDVQGGEPLYQEERQQSQALKSNLVPRG